MSWFRFVLPLARDTGTLNLGLLFVAAWLLPTANSHAEDVVRITDDGRLKRDPVFIQNGDFLVYGVDEGTDKIRLMKRNVETGETVPLHATAPRSELEPAFSLDGRYYAVNHNTGNLSMKMIIRDTQGASDVDIPVKGRGGMRSPTFSPDSKHIVYCFAETGPQHLFRIDVKGENKKQLTDGRGMNNWPSFTPDGKKIVFSSSREGTYEIYSMKADGSDVQRLTDSPTQDIRPSVSPDGARIAFISSRDGNRELYVMDIDGENVRRITDHPERDDYPSWHPDSERVVLVSERRGRSDLYLVQVGR